MAPPLGDSRRAGYKARIEDLDRFVAAHHNLAGVSLLGCAVYLRLRRTLSRFLSLTSCVLCAAGCHNSCYSFAFNGTSGTGNVSVSNPPPSCSLSTANGTVQLKIGTPPGAHSMPGTEEPHFTHLYVTVAGVDAHPSALSEEDSPGWQPLTAELQEHPRQVDLLADSSGTNTAPLLDAVLPAGFYGQIRLRFAGLSENEKLGDANACRRALHCAMTSDGRILPLTFATPAPSFRISPDNPVDGRFYVPPDGAVLLTIELDRDRTFLRPANDSFALAPEFRLIAGRPPVVPEF